MLQALNHFSTVKNMRSKMLIDHCFICLFVLLKIKVWFKVVFKVEHLNAIK